jgi:hypothetical protein
MSGPVFRKQFSIDASGSLDDCLDLIQSVEEAGLDTVTLETMTIFPEENLCSFDVNTLGYIASTE